MRNDAGIFEALASVGLCFPLLALILFPCSGLAQKFKWSSCWCGENSSFEDSFEKASRILEVKALDWKPIRQEGNMSVHRAHVVSVYKGISGRFVEVKIPPERCSIFFGKQRSYLAFGTVAEMYIDRCLPLQNEGWKDELEKKRIVPIAIPSENREVKRESSSSWISGWKGVRTYEEESELPAVKDTGFFRRYSWGTHMSEHVSWEKREN